MIYIVYLVNDCHCGSYFVLIFMITYSVLYLVDPKTANTNLNLFFFIKLSICVIYSLIISFKKISILLEAIINDCLFKSYLRKLDSIVFSF